MNWTDEPATEQQLALLRNSGYVVARPLTLTEAARLIRQYKYPGRQPRPAVSANPPVSDSDQREESGGLKSSSSGDFISESTRMQAHRLRTACDSAKQALAAMPQAPNVRADAASAMAARQEFWLDTCREVKEMHVGSMQVFELYQKHGCRFFAPTREQAQEVLDALDGAVPLWDREHPGLFYQTLELNFPHLVRRC